MKSKNNRTITLDDNEKEKYEKRLIQLKEKSVLSDIIDKTINQDLYRVCDLLPEQFADLIIIDPPYNLTKDFGITQFKSASNEDYELYVRDWMPFVIKALKPNGSIYVCCDWKSSNVIYSVLSDYVTIMNRITWKRDKGRGANKNWKNNMEDIWFGVMNKNDYYFDVDSVKEKKRVIAPYKENGLPKDWVETDEGKFRMTYPSNCWTDIVVPFWSMPENTVHPTQKPEKLIAKLILASCPENGIVFDPFIGSGTTSVTAKKLCRHYCGIEINPEYAVIAEKRLELAETNKKIQGISK